MSDVCKITRVFIEQADLEDDKYKTSIDFELKDNELFITIQKTRKFQGRTDRYTARIPLQELDRIRSEFV